MFAAASEIIRRPPADGGDDSRRRRADRGHGRHSGPGEDPDAAAESGREMEGAAGQSRRPVSLTVVSSLLSALWATSHTLNLLTLTFTSCLPPSLPPQAAAAGGAAGVGSSVPRGPGTSGRMAELHRAAPELRRAHGNPDGQNHAANTEAQGTVGQNLKGTHVHQN